MTHLPDLPRPVINRRYPARKAGGPNLLFDLNEPVLMRGLLTQLLHHADLVGSTAVAVPLSRSEPLCPSGC